MTGRYLVCRPDEFADLRSNSEGRRWFNRPQQIPERWFPREELAAESSAMNVLFGKRRFNQRTTIGAEAWFDRREASRYELTSRASRCLIRKC
jgi:hypothetical protein